MRIGAGYDSHRLVDGRRLILGGVEIPYARGLDGWSDADVISHAVVDAICGAACLGDIGTLFPAGNPRFRDASSIGLLEIAAGMMMEKGLSVVNVDVVVIAESPVLSPFVRQMRETLGAAMGVVPERVSVKAKTNEGLGFIGRGEGMAACAVVLLEP